ncbi:phage holin, lambda family [Serratia plymuthica]|nr:phage holin, lambda family [Serratia plymuthica]MBL3522854.1 phage holin, lambda family [Serratia plymuthica]
MKMPEKNPDFWAQIIAWLAAHKSEGGYALTAFIAAMLRGIYAGKSPWGRRVLDALMCSLFAWFLKDFLLAMGWEAKWASIASVFIGFAGIDYLSHTLRVFVRRKTGIDDEVK